MKPFTFQTPASSANLGPGFDCLALALNLFNTIHVEASTSEEEISIHGEGEDELPRDGSNLLVRALETVFEELNQRPPGYRLSVANEIPLRSGLGSSSAAVAAGVIAGCYLLNKALSPDELLQLASRLEPHADNLAACLMGGFVAVATDNKRIIARSIPIHPTRVAVITPEIELHTLSMREALPRSIPHGDAAYSVSRAILTVEALRNGNYDELRWAMKDRLHQPYRQKFIPGYEAVRKAATEAGAAAVALSGAGPSMIAFAPEKHDQIAQAMKEAFLAVDIRSKWYILQVTGDGAIKRGHS